MNRSCSALRVCRKPGIGVIIVALLVWGGVCDGNSYAEEALRFANISMTDNPFDPLQGETIIISGAIALYSSQSNPQAPVVYGTIDEKMEIPAVVGETAIDTVNEEPVITLATWKFSIEWDGNVPWDTNPQGKYHCTIVAKHPSNPALVAEKTVRLGVIDKSQYPPLVQPQ